MQKRAIGLVLVVSFLILSSVFIVSAFSFSEFFDKLIGKNTITGKVIDLSKSQTCTMEEDCTAQGYLTCQEKRCVASNYEPGKESFSISAWIKTTDINTIQSIAAHWVYSDSINAGYELLLSHVAPGNVCFWGGTGGWQCVQSGIKSNELSFVTLVREGTNVIFYVNGEKKGTGTISAEIPSTGGRAITAIGKTVWDGPKSDPSYRGFVRPFLGTITNLQVWKGQALTEAKIKELYSQVLISEEIANGSGANVGPTVSSNSSSGGGGGGVVSTSALVNRCPELSSAAKAKIEQGRNLSKYYGTSFVTSEGGNAKKNDYIVIYSPQISDKIRVLRVASIPSNSSVNNKVMLTDALTGEAFNFETGTLQTTSTNIDGSTFYLLANNAILNDLDRYIILTWGTGSSAGNQGSESDSLNCTVSQDQYANLYVRSTTPGFSNDIIRLDTSSQKLYSGSPLNTARTALTKSELPSLLADWTMEDSKGNIYNSVQIIYLGSKSIVRNDGNTFYVDLSEIPGEVYNYSFILTKSLNVSDASVYGNVQLYILGKLYTIKSGSKANELFLNSDDGKRIHLINGGAARVGESDLQIPQTLVTLYSSGGSLTKITISEGASSGEKLDAAAGKSFVDKVFGTIRITFDGSTSTCTDSDVDLIYPDGLNYYARGQTEYSSFSEFDFCEDDNSLIERKCGMVVGSGAPDGFTKYSCPNGCKDGACVFVADSLGTCAIKNISVGNTGMCLVGGTYYSVKNNGGCGPGPINLTISYSGNSQEVILNQETKNAVTLNNGVQVQNYGSPCSVAWINLHFGNVQVCSDLINEIKNPAKTDENDERRLNWNNSYYGENYVNGVIENYNSYQAGYYWSPREYQEGQVRYYYVDYEIQVFDNKNVNLSEYSSWNKADPTCKLTNYWVDGKENGYYICNWDVLRNQQEISNSQGSSRQIFWYNNNVVVRLNIYYGSELSDAEVTKLTAQRIGDLLNNIQNNRAKSVDWSNFNIEYPASNELYNTFHMCGSSIVYNWSNIPTSDWSCKTEPLICPEYGYQTKVCTRYNYETRDEEVQENRMDCSPGLCSGCYEPRWFGAKGDNKCIPYGFRFSHQTGEEFKLVERTQTDTISENAGENGQYSLVINSEIEAILTIMTDYELQSMENFTLVPGKSVDVVQKSGSESRTIKLDVLAIHPAVEGKKGYVEFSVTYMDRERIMTTFNAYCDIDGQIKEQMQSDGSGNGAKCQNNYECASNVCSDGECLDIKSTMNEVSGIKVLLVKILCRVSNIGDSGYNSCLSEYGVGAGNF